MNINWIADVLRLNSRIIATQARVSAQGDRILEMLEAGQSTASAEALFKAYNQRLIQLRRLQAELLQEPRSEV